MRPRFSVGGLMALVGWAAFFFGIHVDPNGSDVINPRTGENYDLRRFNEREVRIARTQGIGHLLAVIALATIGGATSARLAGREGFRSPGQMR